MLPMLCLLPLLPTVIQAPATIAPDELYRATRGGPTRMVNSLWTENRAEMKFGEGRSRVTLANLKGPGLITMIHFALPASMKLDRTTVLRIWWDGEATPSVESPLVDFFCDPNGALERVDTIMVNKRRGWNCYFQMPFRKSARVELTSESSRYPGGNWSANPCYAYVMYRPLPSLPADTLMFHAQWRQDTHQLLNEGDEYEAMGAVGKGHFIGWNVTMRGAGSPTDGYSVDQNEKFWIDGEKSPSIEWQGIEDSFGFSWGFPEAGNSFPRTGYQPFYNGAAAYRFCLEDRIAFNKSLRLTIGFGTEERKQWKAMFPAQPPLQFSSVCYWYQSEPHRPFAPLPPALQRRPTMLATATKGRRAEPGEVLALRCGHPDDDIEVLAPGWDFVLKNGYLFNGQPWTGPVTHAWADFKSLEFDLLCPRGTAGTLRLYMLDADNFHNGRTQSLTLNGKPIGEYSHFQQGLWVEVPITAEETGTGRIRVRLVPRDKGNNAVVSYVRFVEAKRP